MKKYFFVLLLPLIAVMSSSCGKVDKDITAAKSLTSRIIPEHAKSFSFKKLDADSVDRFEIESKNGKIIISGNNANSMAVGLNHYLKYYCKTEVSWFADDKTDMPSHLPEVPEKISIDARVKNRFFLNYCTFGYTMPWWRWDDWEHFIDWMALNGINLPLAITGQEAIWYRVWTDLGLTDEEIRSYFTGPAHLPWHRMQNIDRHDGPLPMSWLEDQEALQKQIVTRERELNMRPVLPGFAGHVPPEIKRIFPNAPLSSLGNWCDFDTACWCSFLDPMDTLFTFIQKKFITEETNLYGTDHIYGIDLFNEMTPPSDDPLYLGRVSRQVYESLAAADPDAIWLQMTWLFWNERYFWTNERVEPYITSFPKDKQILLDYYCERTEVWQRTNKYFGVPYIWCYLGNFGGNSRLAGNIDTVNARIENTVRNGGYNFVGLGSTLEGLDCNPFMYEYIFEKAWDFDLHKNVGQWIESLADRHAGKVDENNRAAWKLLADTVYQSPTSPGQASMLNGRPTLKPYQYYIGTTIKYNNINLLNALELLLKAESDTRAHGFDVANVTRQLLSNFFTDLYKDYCKFHEAKDMAKCVETEKIMIDVLTDLDEILNTQSAFLLGKWIDDSRAFGKDDAEKNYYESNARDLITMWAGRDNLLNDYGSRTWAGLVDSYYKGRWLKFFDYANYCFNEGKDFDEHYFRQIMTGLDTVPEYGFETQWYKNRIGQFNPVASGDPIAIASNIAEKYRDLIIERNH